MQNVKRECLIFAGLMGIAAIPGILMGVAFGWPMSLLGWNVFAGITVLGAAFLRWAMVIALNLIGIALLSAQFAEANAGEAVAKTDLYRQSVRSFEREYCSADSAVTHGSADFDGDDLLDEFEIAPCAANLITGERRAGAVIFWLSTLGGEEGDQGFRFYGVVPFEYLGARFEVTDSNGDGYASMTLFGRESAGQHVPDSMECYYEQPYENNAGETVPGEMLCE